MDRSEADPHGVQQLLAILRRQQDGGAGDAMERAGGSHALRRGGDAEPQRQGAQQQHQSSAKSVAPSADDTASTRPDSSSREDLRYISFAQALPHLTQLSKDRSFLQALLDLKSRQDELEQELAREHEKLTIRSPSGDGGDTHATSQEEQQQPRGAIHAWAQDALARWDRLYSAQQQRLQAMGVPCFFVTSEPGHLRRQERVFDVLAGLLE